MTAALARTSETYVGFTERRRLFQTGKIDLIGLDILLCNAGLNLNRVHRKENNGLGKTHQIMLVFERGMPEILDSRKREVFDAFCGNGEDIEGFKWNLEGYANPAINRVPAHIFLQAANASQIREDTSLINVIKNDFVLKSLESRLRPLTTEAILTKVSMVRLAFNVYHDMKGLIPDWVVERPRHGDK